MDESLTLHHKDGGNLRVDIRACGPQDLEEVVALQRAVMGDVAHSELYAPTSREEFEESLRLDHALGAYDGQRLIGYSQLLSLRETSRNLAHDLGDPPEVGRVSATWDGVFVDARYRGYGIMAEFGRIQDGIARAMGAQRILVCVSPENAASLRSIENCGFERVREMALYGGRRRLVLQKSL
jgi:RimJ/RimL family protein N-acetyltransferase